MAKVKHETLVNPTYNAIVAAVEDLIAYQNSRKHTPNRRLNTLQTAVAVANKVVKDTAGALDTDGGTSASSYPARTVAVAVAWFTKINGDKVVRVAASRAELANANTPVTYPYNVPAGFADGLLIADGYPVLVSDTLATIYAELHAAGDGAGPMGKAVYENPGDATAWAAYADWLEEHDMPNLAATIRQEVDGVPVAE